MAEYLLSQRARRDILEIWKYIAEDNEERADEFLHKLIECFAMLGRNPRAGRQRDDIRAGLRGFPSGEYQILYRPGSPGVVITNVVHGRRDLTKLLKSPR